ncbi:MAG: Gfo/Idh/MocA family oxidoreductase [Planctomycetaceae bacterium]|nr:Gfo/Idh/MocA family oxidoreductase [Planctomycetaceae bacterium]
MLNLLAAGSAAAVSGSVVPNAFASDDSRSKPKPRIRVGQIGVGHAHANKLSVYRSSPDYEVVGIVEPNEERRKAAQNQSPYQDLTWMTQEQLLNQPDLQVVLVETEVRNLLDTADVCIDAGKHIHLDKPAGSSLQQYESLLKRAEARNLIVQMGYMYRYNPAVLLLRDLLRNGWLGEIFEVHTVMSKVVPAASRKALAEFSGGIMFELGCHITDLVVGILGEPSSVTSNVKRSTTADDGLADNIIALFDYPRASATVRSSAIEIDGGQRRHLTVCGTRGTFHIQPLDNPTVRMALAEVHDPWKRGYQDVTLPKYARYVGDAADMAAIVREEKACDFSYSHDLAVQRTVLKASGMLD